VAKTVENCIRTKAMDPKKAARLLPLFEHESMGKPRGSATVMRIASNVVVCPRIWHGQPMSKPLLQPVSCQRKVASDYAPVWAMSADYERSILLTFIAISCMKTSGQPYKTMLDRRSSRRTKGIPHIVYRCFATCKIRLYITNIITRASDAYLQSQPPSY
jgi:hypothetical protein